MNNLIDGGNGHEQENCWCDPFLLQYNVQFHRNAEGYFVGPEIYDTIMNDFKSYLNECLMAMKIDELTKEE